MKRNIAVVAGLFVFILSSRLTAEDLAGRWGVGVEGGAAIPVGAQFIRDNGNAGAAIGGFLRRGLTSHLSAALGYDNLSLRNDIRVEDLTLSGIYSCHPQNRWTPVAILGAGLGVGQGNRDMKDLALKAGLGLDYFFAHDYSIGAQAVYHFISDTGGALHLTHALVPAVNLAYYFNGSAQPAPAPAPKPAPVVEKKPVDSDGDGVPDDRDRCPNTPPGAKVDADGCPERAPEKVSIELKVLFDTAKAIVKPEFDNEIKQVADFMRSYPDTTAEIEGHTDSMGNEAYNIDLSQRRADAVRQYLISRFGVSASRLSAKGYGPSRPIADNKTVEGRAKNRRVVATISAVKK